MNWIKRQFYKNMVQPIIKAKPTRNEFRIGVALGLFVGLTPTVGVQMYVCLFFWLLFKKIKKDWNFNLPTSIAMVWVTNPFTVVPIYYIFFRIGIWFQSLYGTDSPLQGIEFFEMRILDIQKAPTFLLQFQEIGKFLFYDTGIPLFLGSLFIAIPTTLIAFFYSQKVYDKLEMLFHRHDADADFRGENDL